MKRRNGLMLAGAMALGMTSMALASGGDDDRRGHGCDGEQGVKIEMMTLCIEDKLDLTEAQMPAWDAAVGAVESASEQRQTMCAAAEAKSKPETVVDALDRAEERMQAGLETVTELRGAVGDLYEVLDDEQRTTLDAMVKDFRHMRG
ncbi:MAG: Spy/CpxP family protein refolding chaperone [Alphaproteobacteria bacterium]|nr:Spy/CpxP family protein refolding chaperone [Alphaproteobacteria bacterium]